MPPHGAVLARFAWTLMMPVANPKVVDTQRAYRLIHFDHATPADEFAGRDVQIVISEDEPCD